MILFLGDAAFLFVQLLLIKKNKRISNISASNFQNIKLSKDVKNVNFNLVNSDSRDVNIFVNHALYNRKKNNVGSEKIIIDEKGSISISNN